MLLEAIRSERQLIKKASLNLANCSFLGSALDEPLPGYSSRTAIRQRLGIGIIERVFAKVVDLCPDADLISDSERVCGVTAVCTHADLNSLVPRLCHETKTHLAAESTNDLGRTGNQGHVAWHELGDILPGGRPRTRSTPSSVGGVDLSEQERALDSARRAGRYLTGVAPGVPRSGVAPGSTPGGSTTVTRSTLSGRTRPSVSSTCATISCSPTGRGATISW
jgi:hypothetical protein